MGWTDRLLRLLLYFMYLILVSMLLIRFMRQYYYAMFGDEAENVDLHRIGFFTEAEKYVAEHESNNSIVEISSLSNQSIRKRLEMFLRVFAAVTSPKQLYLHQLLYAFYIIQLSKADTVVVKLALDCLLAYKTEGIIAYKDTLYKFLEEKEMRNQLVTFSPSITGGDLQPSHRADFIPVLVRVIYSRFSSSGKSSKSSKNQRFIRCEFLQL